MLKIELELADNGVIKTASDDNYNGAGQLFEQRKLYVLENDSLQYFESTKLMLNDMISDLGIDVGGKHDPIQLSVGIDWGEAYMPSVEEIDARIKIINEELLGLNTIKAQLSEIDKTKK
jgi:hypothetical protein